MRYFLLYQVGGNILIRITNWWPCHHTCHHLQSATQSYIFIRLSLVIFSPWCNNLSTLTQLRHRVKIQKIFKVNNVIATTKMFFFSFYNEQKSMNQYQLFGTWSSILFVFWLWNKIMFQFCPFKDKNYCSSMFTARWTVCL